MDTKIVPIEWNGEKVDVELRKLTFGEKNSVQEKAMKTKMIGHSMQVELSQAVLKEESLLVGIKHAPFEVSLDTIRNLPAETGDKLYEELSKLVTITPEKKVE